MRKILFLLIVICICIFCNAQTKNKACTSLLVDIDYKGTIELWDKPNGKLLKKLKHNFADEDYLVLNILGKNDSMYYVKANYSINGTIAKGWIRKNNAALGIYSKAYAGNLKLYQSANKSSTVSAVVKEYTPKIYHVLDYKDGWLLVEIELSGTKYKGWMEPSMHCDNPYSTCN